MSFPTMNSTWKFTRTGLTNVIPLPEGGGPYTVGMDKAGGTYTGQLFWSPNLDASPLDDSWKALTNLNTTDEVAVAFDNTDVRAIMGSITVRPTPVLNKGINAPIAKCEISVTPTNSRGANLKQRHGSGYGSNLIGGSVPVQDEYAALVLADMGVSVGSFFEMQDEVLSPLTDTGPAGVTNFIDASGPVLNPLGPWEKSKSIRMPLTQVQYTSASIEFNLLASEEETLELWYAPDLLDTDPADIFSANSVGGIMTLGMRNGTGGHRFVLKGSGATADDPADPGAWLVSTAYTVGDRVRAAADNSRIAECTIAGTSAACEPTWPTDGTTVVDGGTLTWVDCGQRNFFNNFQHLPEAAADGQLDLLEGTTAGVVGVWTHLVGVRRSTAWELYVNGVKEDELILATVPGAAGTPPRADFTISYSGATGYLGNSAGGSEGAPGSAAYAAVYNKALTPAEILSHYNKGVELGL